MVRLQPSVVVNGESRDLGCVISQDELILRRAEWKRNGKRVVFASGAFDLATGIVNLIIEMVLILILGIYLTANSGRITAWLRDNATESLAHAQEAGEMIMRLHRRPALGIAALPTTPHNTIDEILTESIQREESGVELYRELLALVKDKSVVLEEYATRLVSAEAVHLREMELMLMKRAPD